MRKTLALMKTSIKGFLRNWRSIILLVIFPLLLVGSIFVSFNPNGIQKIPVGFIIDGGDDLATTEFKSAVDYFMVPTDYDSLLDCMRELELGIEYVCLDINVGEYIQLNVHYDNTREPIIWEVVERIKNTVDYIQKEKTKELAQSVLDEFSSAIDSADDVKVEIRKVRQDLSSLKTNLDISLGSASTSLDSVADSADGVSEDIDGARSIVYSIKSASSFSEERSHINDIENDLDVLEGVVPPEYGGYISDSKSSLNEIESGIVTADNRIDNFADDIDDELRGAQGLTDDLRDYAYSLSSTVNSLQSQTNQIDEFVDKLIELEESLDTTGETIKEVSSLDAEILVNPVLITNYPTYIPEFDVSIEDLESQNSKNIFSMFSKGINLIGLQTIYPSILILIILFLSLLISSFMCLSEINSSADVRVKLVRGVFFSHFFSIYFSSIIIIMIPIISILMVGQVLFQLPIIVNLSEILLVVFLLASTFVFVGLMLAYLVKKESSTLLISTFILVFLIFFSGFILPIERMSDTPNYLASNSPTSIALRGFDKIVFYDLGNLSIESNIYHLAAWFGIMMLVAMIVKFLRKA